MRVRFTSASAEAVAKSRIGIGDEVVLSLNGASWEEDTEAKRTPGKSVDGELFFRRKLGLRIVKAGAGGDVQVNVDADVSPPSSREKPEELATPLPKNVNHLRSSLDGVVESLPSYTYTSPAFVKRLRLSGESFLDSAYAPFNEGGLDLESRGKGQRTSFGSNLKWRYAEKTPSPTKSRASDVEESPLRRETSQESQHERENGTSMLPPPLPQLQLTSGTSISEEAHRSTEQEGPSTPKSQPVKSPTLPLPSPFPAETAQLPFGLPESTALASSQGNDTAQLQHQPERALVTERQELFHEDQQMFDRDTADETIKMQTYLSDTEEDTEADDPPKHQTRGSTNEIALPDDIVRNEDDEEMPDGSSDVRREDLSKEAELSRTPTKEPLSDFGLDGTTAAAPSEHVTPQSEKDRIMAQTYRSLFGFQSTTPTKAMVVAPEQPEPESPTLKNNVPEMTRARLQAGGVRLEEEEQMPKLREKSQPETEGTAVADMAPAEPPSMQLPAPSSAQRSEIEVIELGSSSEDEMIEDEGEEEGEETPKATEAAAAQGRFESPEIQDSVEDTETEDLMDPKFRAANTATVQEPSIEAKPAPVEEGISPPPPESIAYQEIMPPSDRSRDSTRRDTTGQHVPSLQADGQDSNLSHANESLSNLISHPKDASPEAVVATADHDVVVQSETMGPELATPPATAAPTVIDLVSSSPIEQEETDFAQTKQSDNGILEDLIDEDSFAAEAMAEIEAVTQPELKGVTPDATAIDGFLPVEGQEQETQSQTSALQEPSYPSLPMTPSNSQSLQGMPSQTVLESGIPETFRSALPPTPQLTQVESSTQLQQLVDEELPTSQLTQAESSSQLQELLEDQLTTAEVMQHDDIGLSQRSAAEEKTPKPEVKKPSRKSLGTRVSDVPDVISAWFSPRRSSGVLAEDSSRKEDNQDQTSEKSETRQINGTTQALTNGHALSQPGPTRLGQVSTNGLYTSLAYFTPLARLDELLNPSSQQAYGTKSVDVFAVVTDQTKEPSRAKSGPRDYFTIFRVADSSLPTQTSVRVEVFRPWMATLPVAQVGDVILLREFVVKSRKRQAYLLSTDASAWCVWRHLDTTIASDNGNKPVWARKASSGDAGAVREEVKGPPIELAGEEREHARQLRQWWELLRREEESNEYHDMGDDSGMNGQVTRPITAKL